MCNTLEISHMCNTLEISVNYQHELWLITFDNCNTSLSWCCLTKDYLTRLNGRDTQHTHLPMSINVRACLPYRLMVSGKQKKHVLSFTTPNVLTAINWTRWRSSWAHTHNYRADPEVFILCDGYDVYSVSYVQSLTLHAYMYSEKNVLPWPVLTIMAIIPPITTID